MSEKIKELAELAEVWTTCYDEDRCEVDLEKFAKLILEEAMAIVRDKVAYQSDWDCADDVVKKVNEHFGVDYE